MERRDDAPVIELPPRKARRWDEKTEEVLRCSLKAMPPAQITAMTGIPEHQVTKILREAEFKKGMKRIERKVVTETFKDKIPALQEIGALTLSALKSSLQELEDDETRHAMITSVRDVQALAKILTDVNTLLRLELGESTANVATINHSYQETRHVIQQLRKVDPVFDYPALEQKEEEAADDKPKC